MRSLGRMSSRARSSVIGAIAFALVFALALPGLANHLSLGLSKFEIKDGNLVVDGGTGHTGFIDWVSVGEARQQDDATGQQDNSFTQGTDENDEPPVIGAGGIPNNKSDLSFFGVYVEADTPGWLHMFWTRVQDPSGTTNMDFEFNKNKCFPGQTQTNVCSGNNLTPARSTGDVLITYNLSSGGTNVSLWLHRWIISGECDGSQEGDGSNKTATAQSPCWSVGEDLTAASLAAGSINTTAIANADDDGLSNNGLSARTFGEATVDLSAIFGGGCSALGSAYLKSRSSDTFTSAMKDFIKPVEINVSNCGSIRAIKKDDAGANLAGAKFKLYKDDLDPIPSEGPPAVGFEPGAGDVQLNADGSPGSFECETTSNGFGNCTWSNLTFGKYWLFESQVPPGGYSIDAVNPKLVNVTSTTRVDVQFTNSRQPAQIKVKKQDDLGNALAGVVFTLWRDNTPFGPPDGNGSNQDSHGAEDTSTAFSCTTGADGTCVIGSILPVGKFWIVEGTPPAGYAAAPDQWVELAQGDDLTATPFTFVDPRLHNIIVIVCHEGTNTLAPSDVTIGASTKTSLAAGSLTPAQQAAICATGGANFDGFGHGNQTATNDVGSDAHP